MNLSCSYSVLMLRVINSHFNALSRSVCMAFAVGFIEFIDNVKQPTQIPL